MTDFDPDIQTVSDSETGSTPAEVVIRRALMVPSPSPDGEIVRPAPSTPLTTAVALRSYVDTERIGSAYDTVAWTIEDEITLYAQVARDTDLPPKIRMAAAKALHDLAIKTLLLRGDLAEVSAQRQTTRTSPDGTVVTALESMRGIVQRAQSSPSRAHELAHDTGKQIPPEQSEFVSPDATLADASRIGTHRGLASGPGPDPDVGGSSDSGSEEDPRGDEGRNRTEGTRGPGGAPARQDEEEGGVRRIRGILPDFVPDADNDPRFDPATFGLPSTGPVGVESLPARCGPAGVEEAPPSPPSGPGPVRPVRDAGHPAVP